MKILMLLPIITTTITILLNLLKMIFKLRGNINFIMAISSIVTSLAYFIFDDSLLFAFMWWFISLLNYSTYRNELK
jgi:hypothetical protein